MLIQNTLRAKPSAARSGVLKRRRHALHAREKSSLQHVRKPAGAAKHHVQTPLSISPRAAASIWLIAVTSTRARQINRLTCSTAHPAYCGACPSARTPPSCTGEQIVRLCPGNPINRLAVDEVKRRVSAHTIWKQHKVFAIPTSRRGQ